MQPEINDNEINISANNGTAPIQQHSSVLYGRFQPSNQLPWIVGVLIKTKLVKTDKQAQKVLLIIVVLLLVAAVVFFALAFQKPEVNI